jgi:hypothetical protein
MTNICVSMASSTRSMALVELEETTGKYETYRPPEGKAFSGMFEKFGRS